MVIIAHFKVYHLITVKPGCFICDTNQTQRKISASSLLEKNTDLTFSYRGTCDFTSSHLPAVSFSCVRWHFYTQATSVVVMTKRVAYLELLIAQDRLKRTDAFSEFSCLVTEKNIQSICYIRLRIHIPQLWPDQLPHSEFYRTKSYLFDRERVWRGSAMDCNTG